MKHAILITLFLVLAVHLSAQLEIKTFADYYHSYTWNAPQDIRKQKIRVEKIFSCRLKGSRIKDSILSKTIDYDESGNVVQVIFYNNDGVTAYQVVQIAAHENDSLAETTITLSQRDFKLIYFSQNGLFNHETDYLLKAQPSQDTISRHMTNLRFDSIKNCFRLVSYVWRNDHDYSKQTTVKGNTASNETSSEDYIVIDQSGNQTITCKSSKGQIIGQYFVSVDSNGNKAFEIYVNGQKQLASDTQLNKDHQLIRERHYANLIEMGYHPIEDLYYYRADNLLMEYRLKSPVGGESLERHYYFNSNLEHVN